MSRDDFLERCIKAALHQGEHLRFCDVDWKPQELVSYMGVEYVPVEYSLGFDRNGKAKHCAVLRDVRANYSLLHCRLEDIFGV